MKNFTYYQPTSVQQAVGLLDAKWGGSELLGGGTDLLDLQKEYIAQPDKVVSLTGIKELVGVQALEGGAAHVRIGAGTRLADIAAHADLRAHYPALTTAAGMVGGPQIRNMGTLGGNLCQRNRCWYFRDEHVNCWLKGGAKCYALDGENQYHAVFSQGSKCVIVGPSTLAPALVALEAVAEVQGPKGKRTIELAKFFQSPTEPGQREHVLAPNEVVTSVVVKSASGGAPKNASYEVRQKQSYDWPLVQAAVALKMSGTKVTAAKVVLGHVSQTPLVAGDAAKALEGKEVTEATAAAAGKAAAKGAKPLSQNGYKVRLIEVAVKRAVLTAAGAKKYWKV